MIPGPNGCTCGFNGDCNCPFVPSAASDATALSAAKERPILFSGAMVRALLAGTKTQTRRIVRDYSPGAGGDSPTWRLLGDGCWYPIVEDGTPHSCARGGGARCPYGAPGDRLWVKETWRTSCGADAKSPSALGGRGWPIWYEADEAVAWTGARNGGPAFTTPGKTRVSIHMPRWASRITLEITGVRVERLHAITEEGARAEGVVEGIIPADEYGPVRIGYVLGADDGKCTLYPTEREAFGAGWKAINGVDSWAANPWVWVVEFKRIEEDRRG